MSSPAPSASSRSPCPAVCGAASPASRFPDLLHELRRRGRDRHPVARLRRRAKGPLPQGRARRLRREQPAERPPRRGPAPRREDHRRAERDLDPRARPGAPAGPRARGDGRLVARTSSGGVQFQVREIVFSVFQWDEGQFHFEESVLPEKETHHRRPRRDRARPRGHPAHGRRGRRPRALPRGLPGARARRRAARRACSQPYEQHVLSLVDGERSVARDLPRERGGRGRDPEGALRLPLHGHRPKAKGERSAPSTRTSCPRTASSPSSTPSTRCTATSSRYMVREVGPIAENVLAKYLGTLREARQDVLAGRARCARTARSTRRRSSATSARLRRGRAPPRARGRPQRAALRGAARGQADARRRARERSSCASCARRGERARRGSRSAGR